MIRCRLRASLHRLLSGENVLVSARKMVIPLTRSLSYTIVFDSFQSKGFESLKRPLHTSTNDDDDFAEIGLPLEKDGGVIPKLMTEKPDHFLRIKGTEKTSRGSSVKADSCAGKDVSPEKGNSSCFTSQDLENDNHGSSNFRTSSSVTIENVPSIINLFDLKKAISAFGKVTKASKRSVLDGLDCCDIEFKSLESSKMALVTGSVNVKNFNLPIRPLQSLETVTIRINNISSVTADSVIHSTCTLCGPFEGLVRTKEDVVDALFSVKNEEDTKSIIYKLNSTVMDGAIWSAHLQTSETPLMTNSDNGNPEGDAGLKISESLADLKRETHLKSICAEDLEYLHHSLLHLENYPQSRSYFSNMD